ncbi:MAG: hypothetical protein HY235_12410 [Acidobacteria bacterium]|nr:hypothetical protein [Acidobacteriota bacterium]
MVFLLLVASVWPAWADWTQWGGPNRNFTTLSKGQAANWSRLSGPPKFSSRNLGDGYSAIVTDGRTLHTMYRIERRFRSGAADVRRVKDGQDRLAGPHLREVEFCACRREAGAVG